MKNGICERLKGVTTALVTPFHQDGSIDFEAFRKLIHSQIEGGVSALLPLGTTGETPTLSREECEQVISVCVEEVNGRVPVLVGTGTNATSSTIENTLQAEKLGADVALIATPYYNKPSQAGILAHYREICKSTSIPILQYNVPGRTAVNVLPETMVELAKLDQIVGVKEACGNIHQITETLQRLREFRKDFLVLSGDDELTFLVLALGGNGVVSVVSNLFPDRVVELVKTALEGDFSQARELHYSLLPIFRGAFFDTNPCAIKHLMMLNGELPCDAVRLPLISPSVEIKKKLSEVLALYAGVPVAKAAVQ